MGEENNGEWRRDWGNWRKKWEERNKGEWWWRERENRRIEEANGEGK